MDRRRFTFAAILPAAAFLTGCTSRPKPARDATLFHNNNVRDAVAELDQGVNQLEMRSGLFNAENWQDALANIQMSITRVRADVDELKRALGYSEPA